MKHRLAVDFARVYESADDRGTPIATRIWGDPLEVLDATAKALKVRIVVARTADAVSAAPQDVEGFIKVPKGMDPAALYTDAADAKVLKLSFIDVQQGDGAVIETPRGRLMLVDGGENKLFARYLAARLAAPTEAEARTVDALVVTHGDADHFAGLRFIADSETAASLDDQPWKRVFIHPLRIFHNGLVKRADKAVDVALGDTVEFDGRKYLTGLVDDPRKVPPEQMNTPFRAWADTLDHWEKRGAIELRRLKKGDDAAFGFLHDEDVFVEVLGPLEESIDGAPALPYLGEPPSGPPAAPHGTDDEGFRGNSPSHTINGHSVVLRLRYGGFHVLLTGDLNDQAERALTRAHNHGDLSLQAEVLKVPHHGSADFSAAFLEAVAPVVSVVSSGDESTRTEYIHPRAVLLGSLGRWSRTTQPALFSTELTAFFSRVGMVYPAAAAALPANASDDRYKGAEPFYAFRRSAYGMVEVRTDGERLVALARGAVEGGFEGYAYVLDDHGAPQPAALRRA